MGADQDGVYAVGNLYIAKGSGKGLFLFMWVKQFPIPDLRSIRCLDVPAIGIMIPASVRVAHRNGKGPARSGLFCCHGFDHCRICMCRASDQGAGNKGEKPVHIDKMT